MSTIENVFKKVKNFFAYIFPGLLAGSLSVFGFPCFDSVPSFSLAGFVSWVPLYYLLLLKNKKRAVFNMMIWGFVFFMVFLKWLTVFHPAALPALTVYVTLLYTLQAFLVMFVLSTLERVSLHVFKNRFRVSRLIRFLSPLIAAGAFTGLEYFRTVGFLGFPYGILAYSQYKFLPFIQIADLFGVLGVSFILHYMNALAGVFVIRLKEANGVGHERRVLTGERLYKTAFRCRQEVLTVMVLLFVVLAYGYVQMYRFSPSEVYDGKFPRSYSKSGNFSGSENPKNHPVTKVKSKEVNDVYNKFLNQSARTPVKVSLVQPWFDYNQRWSRRVREKLFRKLEKLSLEAAFEKPDIVFWPESSLFAYYEYMLKQNSESSRAQYARQFQKFFKEYHQYSSNTWFLTGTLGIREVASDMNKEKNRTAVEGGRRPRSVKDAKTAGVNAAKKKMNFYNSAIFIDNKAEVKDRYSKRKLVPFAEWFPYGDIFPFIKKILDSAHASSFTPGEKLTVFKHPLFKFSVVVCYGDCFSDICRNMVRRGAECLVVITNDGWSYTDVSQVLHYMFSVFRSIETRRPMIRSTNSGVTAIVDRLGRMKASLGFFKEGVKTASFFPETVKTFYYFIGDYPFLILEILFLMAVFTAFGVRFFLPKRQGIFLKK